MNLRPRHVPWVDIGRHTATGDFGITNRTESLDDLVNRPPQKRTAEQLMSVLVYQMAALIEATDKTNKLLEGVRRDMKTIPDKAATAQAKAEEKAAKARERAAIAEHNAKLAEPPVIIQAGLAFKRDRIVRKF